MTIIILINQILIVAFGINVFKQISIAANIKVEKKYMDE